MGEIRAYLNECPHVIRDPRPIEFSERFTKDSYFVIPKNSQKWYLKKMAEEPNKRRPIGLLLLYSTKIHVDQDVNLKILKIIRRFVKWILCTWDCKIIDPISNDITDEVLKHPETLKPLYPV